MADAHEYGGQEVTVAFGAETLLIVANMRLIHLTPDEARKLARRLNEVADMLPLREDA